MALAALMPPAGTIASDTTNAPASFETRRNGTALSSGFQKGTAMKLRRWQFLHLAASAVTLIVISVISLTLPGNSAWSQTKRTIKVIVPFPAGGTADLVARILGEQ